MPAQKYHKLWDAFTFCLVSGEIMNFEINLSKSFSKSAQFPTNSFQHDFSIGRIFRELSVFEICPPCSVGKFLKNIQVVTLFFEMCA